MPSDVLAHTHTLKYVYTHTSSREGVLNRDKASLSLSAACEKVTPGSHKDGGANKLERAREQEPR